jgi:hypothetical protein
MYDNIGSWFDDDVAEAGAAVAGGALGKGERVVVFHRNYRMADQAGARSVVYELVKDTSRPEGFRRQMIKVYDPGVNAVLTAGIMNNVVGDIRAAIPAPRWGLAFGSHGLGWIPKSMTVPISRAGEKSAARAGEDGEVGAEHPFAEFWTIPDNPRTRYFESSWGEKLDVGEFVEALRGDQGGQGVQWQWDFIILDDCFMASVESLYEMRYLADYVIASPTEIMWPGFPYNLVVENLFAGWKDDLEASVKAVAGAFVEDYLTGASGRAQDSAPCATIAAVRMDQLDLLALTVQAFNLRPEEVDSVDGIQYYERFTRPAHLFHDLDDYLIRIRKETTPTEYNAFVAQLNRTVVYKGHTPTFYSRFSGGGREDIIHFSGLATFIPWSGTVPMFDSYYGTAWFGDVYAR